MSAKPFVMIMGGLFLLCVAAWLIGPILWPNATSVPEGATNNPANDYECSYSMLPVSDNGNGTYTPSMINKSKLCYYPTPDPKYVPELKTVKIAGYQESGIFSHCRAVTDNNEIYTVWDDSWCIYLTPGNTVEISIGLKEEYPAITEKRILSARIIPAGSGS